MRQTFLLFLACLLILFHLTGCAYFQSERGKKIGPEDLDILSELLMRTIEKKVEAENGQTKELEIQNVQMNPSRDNQVWVQYSVVYELPATQTQPHSEILYSAIATLEAKKEGGHPTLWEILSTLQLAHSMEFLSPQTLEIAPSGNSSL